MAEADTGVSQEELDAAQASFEQGTKLIATDPEEAVELLGKVLEVRNKHYGESAIECVDTYLWYGRALLEQSRSSTDALGSHPKAKAAAASSDKAADEPDAADSHDKAEGEEVEDGDEDQDGDEEGEEEQGADEEGEEEDDLKLAWGVLDVAKNICAQAGVQQHASTLAAIHLTMGDVAAEEEDFGTALDEYRRSQTLLENMGKTDQRRLAGVHFATMMIHLMNDKLSEARVHCKTAIELLESRRDQIMVIMDTPVEGETGEDVDKEIDELEKQLDDINASLKDLKDRLEDVDNAIKEQATFKDALKAAMKTIVAMQDNNNGASTSASGAGTAVVPAATTSAPLIPGAAPSAFVSGPSSTAFTAQSAPVVQNLGVVGRGRTRITLQPCQPSNTGAVKPSLPAKRPLSDVSSCDPATEASVQPTKEQAREVEGATENTPLPAQGAEGVAGTS